jgi:hypothetical protein
MPGLTGGPAFSRAATAHTLLCRGKSLGCPAGGQERRSVGIDICLGISCRALRVALVRKSRSPVFCSRSAMA